MDTGLEARTTVVQDNKSKQLRAVDAEDAV
jgi:hypothetical protein